MGIFDKLFGSKQAAKNQKGKSTGLEIDKTSEMMDEEAFWALVESSLQNADDQDEQEHFLIKEIEKLSPKQMIGFRLRTDKLLYDTYNSEMWCAAYLMNGGCSDDGFEYFRNWLISRGKETYCRAKDHPDNLISEVVEGTEYYEFEGFWYVALSAFEKKTGQDLYDYISDDFIFNEGSYPDVELSWKEEEPETMRAICPILFEKLWRF